MAIKLADLSFIRRSTAEVSVLRELLSLAHFKGDERSEDYLTHKCQMTTDEFRTVMDKLAESGLIHHSMQGQGKSTFHYFHLRRDKVEQFIAQGQEFVFKTLQGPKASATDLPTAVPAVLEAFSLFRQQSEYRDLADYKAWIEFCRLNPLLWIKKVMDAKAATGNTDKS